MQMMGDGGADAGPSVLISTLMLVDLAGSERQSKTGAIGKRLSYSVSRSKIGAGMCVYVCM